MRIKWQRNFYVTLYPKKTCRKEVGAASVVGFTSTLIPVHFDLPIPLAKASYILLCVFDTIHKGEIVRQPDLNGLVVVKCS